MAARTKGRSRWSRKPPMSSLQIGAEDERERALRRDADRAPGRRPSDLAEIWPQGRRAVQGGRENLRCPRFRSEQKTNGSVRYDVMLTERRVEDLQILQKYGRKDEGPFKVVEKTSDVLASDRSRRRTGACATT